jgi:uncharacterized protein YjbI with pentapeptide repeats
MRSTSSLRHAALVISVSMVVALLECFPSGGARAASAPADAESFAAPTADSARGDLNQQKLQAEVRKLQAEGEEIQARNGWRWLNNATAVAAVVTAFVGILGVIFGSQRWRKDFQASKDKREEERFMAVLAALSSTQELTQSGAALMLRSFFARSYDRFCQSAFDATVTRLRLCESEPAKLSATDQALSQALVPTFTDGLKYLRDKLARKEVPLFQESAVDVHVKYDDPANERRRQQQQRYLNARGVRLPKAFLWKADLRGIFMPDASLQDADLSGADLRNAILWGDTNNPRTAQLVGIKLYDAKLDCADLGRADLAYAKLERAHLRHARLNGATLFEAKMRGVTLTDEAELREADLTQADLTEAKLWDADLRNATLTNAVLHRAEMHRTNLRGADLRGAQLQGAKLDGAKLEGADLRGAQLAGSEFANTCYSSVEAADAEGKLLPATQWPEGGPPPGTVDTSRSLQPRDEPQSHTDALRTSSLT